MVRPTLAGEGSRPLPEGGASPRGLRSPLQGVPLLPRDLLSPSRPAAGTPGDFGLRSSSALFCSSGRFRGGHRSSGGCRVPLTRPHRCESSCVCLDTFCIAGCSGPISSISRLRPEIGHFPPRSRSSFGWRTALKPRPGRWPAAPVR